MMSRPPAGARGDVRMRGFAERADVEEVERFLAEHAVALAPEAVPVTACAGRVLASAVVSEVDVPGFPRSAMDGYAVRGEDTFGASAYDPLALEVVGVALPGSSWEGAIGPRQAVRIMTGAPLPEGADAVVRAEVCSENDGRVAVSDPGSCSHGAARPLSSACEVNPRPVGAGPGSGCSGAEHHLFASQGSRTSLHCGRRWTRGIARARGG